MTAGAGLTSQYEASVVDYSTAKSVYRR
jgi:hypothetical protein